MTNMATKSIEQAPSQTVLEEKISPAVRQAFMGNFRNANEAVNELIDNCMADRMSHRRLDVQIELNKKKGELIITNCNGFGMDLVEAQGFLTWGETTRRGLSRWGVGGKAAIGYLGTGFVLQFKSFKEAIAYEIEDRDWEKRESNGRLGLYVPKRAEVSARPEEGFVRFRIIGLKMKIDEKKLNEHIANIYRRVLMKGDAHLRIGTAPVQPLELPIYDPSHAEYFRESTPFNKPMDGWIGRLLADSPKKGPIKGGIRCCAAGRLITQSEYFGHHTPSYKASLSNLIGEIEIEFVPMGLKKTEFDIESKEWKWVKEVMYRKLEPHINTLLKVKDKVHISQREWDSLNEAREIIQKAFERLEMKERLFQWAGKGRKRPEPIESTSEPIKERHHRTIPEGFHREPNGDIVADAVETGQPLPPVPECWRYRDDKYGAIKRKYAPRTFPPDDPIGNLQRLSTIPYKLHPMPENMRSELKDLGADNLELRINVNFPLYKAYKGTKGDLWYLIETATLEMAKTGTNGDMTIDEYMDQVNEIVVEAYRLTAQEET
jgi:hypothetical protein